MKIHTVQLHLGDLLEGTQDMDNGEYGAYVALFLAFYNLPDQEFEKDDRRMARMAKCDSREWRRVKNKVLSKFVDLGTKVTHNRVKKDVELYSQKSEINKLNALKRHNSTHANAHAKSMRNASETDATQDPRPKTQDKKDIKPLTPLPDWVPSDAWESFVKHRGKSFTSTAQKLTIQKLDDLRQQGNDPTQVLNQSVMNDWKGIFAIKGNQNHAQPTDIKNLRGHLALEALGKQAHDAVARERGIAPEDFRTRSAILSGND